MRLPQPPERPSIVGTPAVAHGEIDAFAQNVGRFRRGDIAEARFLEYRLRHGVYGMRQDGVHMMRSKLPLGLMAADQLEAFADLTERYASGIAHLTTRQDIQVHFVQLEASVDVMRVLADARMTCREACGNVVRNVVASELAGVQPDEAFDVTPWGVALAKYLLCHEDAQSLGRKFKISLAGSFDGRWNLAAIHDVGLTAVVREGMQGFHVVVGGGLGAVPHEARVLYEFVPAAEIMPLTLAVLRVFGRLGEKRQRARARLKFLVAKLGVDAFRAEVEAAREGIPAVAGLAAVLEDPAAFVEQPLHPPGAALPKAPDAATQRWLDTAVLPQRQPGYATVVVRVPRGDLTPDHLRGLATLLRAHTGDTLRIGVDQNLYLRFVPFDRLLAVRAALTALGLGKAGAGGLVDPTTCPGADTCKLGITSPRSLGRVLETTLVDYADDPVLGALRVKVSGCPNGCAQHHIADIGLFGAARTVEGTASPHYMLFLSGRPGGAPRPDAAAPGSGLGVRVGKLPAGRVPGAIARLLDHYQASATPAEPWSDWVQRLGRKALQALLDDLTQAPSLLDEPGLFVDLGQDRPFAVQRGVGECAGKAVGAEELLLLEADRAAEGALAELTEGAPALAVQHAALQAFRTAARALLATEGTTTRDPGVVDAAFQARFYDTGRIFEGVGHHYLQATREPLAALQDADRLRRLVEEASLFVEEAHTLVAQVQRGPRGGTP